VLKAEMREKGQEKQKCNLHVNWMTLVFSNFASNVSSSSSPRAAAVIKDLQAASVPLNICFHDSCLGLSSVTPPNPPNLGLTPSDQNLQIRHSNQMTDRGSWLLLKIGLSADERLERPDNPLTEFIVQGKRQTSGLPWGADRDTVVTVRICEVYCSGRRTNSRL
jgi:hypothetical protein